MRLYKKLVVAAFCATVNTSAWCQEKSVESAAFTVGADYPGGNILVEQMNSDGKRVAENQRRFFGAPRIVGKEDDIIEIEMTGRLEFPLRPHRLIGGEMWREKYD